MNMLKRTLAMLLVLCMLVSVVPMAALADDGAQGVAGASEDISADGNNDAALADNEPDADNPDADASKTDESKADESKTDESKTDESKTDESKTDESKTDVSKTDESKTDESKTDESKTDESKTDESKTDEIKIDEIKIDEIKTDETNAIMTLDLDAQEETSYNYEYSILHLDCGRKYFTKDWIIALINEMAAAGYNQLQLAFGNDGLRFLLDDMTVTANGTTYSGEKVTAGIKVGNKAYYDAGDSNELTEDEMDAIIAHANSKGIAIVPHMNMPGHMDAILDAIEYVGISDAHFTGYTTSARSLNLNNDAAVAFTKALLQKYVDYFADNGCKFFHIGADEYANDAYNGSMGFPSMGSTLYTKFATFVNDCADIVKDADMTPRAWNDGISYTGYSDSFDTDIQITYWSQGWSGYSPAYASDLRDNGHAMINTHGDYYYILGKDDKWTPEKTTTHNASFYTEASTWSNTSFYGSTVSDPIGSMFCIWCDYPNAETETQIAENVRLVLRAMAAEMKDGDANSISTEVVSGGFNEDGTLAGGSTTETREWKTVTDETTAISVSGYELTDVTVTDATVSAIEGASKVKAWDIKPHVNDTAYTEKGTVKLPVPADWNTSLVKGFYVENGQAVPVEGTYADGFYTFDMPHFSEAGIYEAVPAAEGDTTEFDQEIELNVGDTHEIVIKDVDYNGEYATNPPDIATVVAKFTPGEGETGPVQVTDISVGSAYYLSDGNGNFLNSNAAWTTDISEAAQWTVSLNGSYYQLFLTAGIAGLYFDSWNQVWAVWDYYSDDYILTSGALYPYWNENAKVYPYVISDTVAVDQSTITFTGIAPGTTYATVGDTTYKIIVHGTVPITIKYQTEDGTVIKTETVTVADNATTYTVSNFNHNGKFYVVENANLTIDPKNTTTYEVIVTETTEDLSAVTPLTLEYWQTNTQVVDGVGSTTCTRVVTALEAYSENGIEVITLVPEDTYTKSNNKETDPQVNYWRSRLLNRSTNEQSPADGDDETLNGTGFTKIRYWNGTWAVYTADNEWLPIETLADYQFVLYFMNDMNLADEVSVGTSDWGKKGDGTMAGQYLGLNHVSIAFQVVYEDGTTSPATTSAADLDSFTYLVDSWGNRGVGTIALNQIGDYQIWKVTAETGTHTTSYNTWDPNSGTPAYVTDFVWDENEMTVWEDAKNPVSHYTILNPANNPSKEGAYANLTWDEENESILIRIYIKTVATEDSLKVVYYDEKFGAVLEEFNIIVPADKNFLNAIIDVETTEGVENLPPFVDNPARLDATGYGIVNALEKTQNFETNLVNVAVTNNRYNKELYKYTGSVISEDGKTITHYYTINQSALSPNFVVDFGLPLTFNLSDVVKEGIATVNDVSVTPTTKFGTLSYNSGTKVFTYTPTEILTTIDVLTISILFDGDTTATTTNVGVTPATTVYYEESFVNWGSGWTGGNTKPTMQQNTAILGEDTNNYGYDPVYANTAGASNGTNATTSTIGAKGTFTFTGNGIQVFANGKTASGYVSVQVKNSAGKTVNVSMVDTVIGAGDTGATSGQTGNLYGLPIVSLIDLQNIPHDTYTVTISKVMDSEPVYIDGIRVFNTVENSSIFVEDLEDNPNFYEMRDAVLHAIGVADDTSADYTTMYEQVYNAVADSNALIVDESVPYGNSTTIQDLLDNGPKNEVFLYAGQTLKFKVSTDRVMQIGLKAPNGATTASIKVGNSTRNESINSSVDMFYSLADKAESVTEYSVEIKNNGSTILSVTELKICDDPNAAFVPFTLDEIKDLLCGDEVPEKPTEPEIPTQPETPSEPSKPVEPEETEPSKPVEPEEPTKPGKPDKPGQNKPGKPAEKQKDAKLKITYINLFGKKVDSVTLVKTGNANQRCIFSAAEIIANAPARRHAVWLLPVVTTYGSNVSIIVPVL